MKDLNTLLKYDEDICKNSILLEEFYEEVGVFIVDCWIYSVLLCEVEDVLCFQHVGFSNQMEIDLLS